MVGVTKAVSERFGKGGIADRMIWFNGFPFLDNKEDHTFGVPVSQVMKSDLTSLPATGLEVGDVEKILADGKNFQGFPIVENTSSNILLGYIGRTELRYALDKAKREETVSQNARCNFSSQDGSRSAVTPSALTPGITFDSSFADSSGHMSIDFSKFVDPTPLAVHPRLPLETVMELFKKLGPRVILVEHRGRLTGLVTVKDCLKYQFQAEAHVDAKDDSALQAGQEALWKGMRLVGGWIEEKIGRLSGGRLKLSSDSGSPPGSARGNEAHVNDEAGNIYGVELDPRSPTEGLDHR